MSGDVIVFLSLGVILIYTLTAFGFCWGLGGSPLTLPLRCKVESFAAAIEESAAGEISEKTARRLRRDVKIIRFLLHLVECPACLGFHVGWLTGALVLPIFSISGQLLVVLALILGFYTAGANYVLGRLTGLIAEP